MRFDDNVKQLEEGLWDRTKARAAGVGGAVKGLGQRVAGGVKGAVAGATGNVAGAQAAAQQGKQGEVAGPVAKINSYKATAQQKIKKLTDEILGDLSKLGIDIKANQNIANGFIGNLNKGFDNLVQGLQGSAPAAAPTGATPPKLKSKSPTPATAAPTTAPSTPTTSTSAAPAPAPSTPAATSSTPSTPAPMDDKAIIDDLNKNKEQLLGNDGLIGKAKFVAGQRGIGGSGKGGVILLRSGPSGDEGVEQAKAELAKKYNVSPEKLVELLGQVFTESKKHKKHISSFIGLYKKI